jgi:segregation and condensation protein A
MDYKVEINNFEGPMDLLLHLIKKSEVDICDISILDITKQYMDYINLMESLNLNIASEYLVMAAELIEIKSSILLPKKQVEVEDDYEDDPRENLINRLIEYEKYKKISELLKEYEQDRKKIHIKSPSDLMQYTTQDKSVQETFDMNDLMNAFNKVLERKELDKPLNTKITNKEYSVSERSIEIKKILTQKKKIEFTDLFDVVRKDYIVVTFLAILNMARHNELKIIQENNFDNIIIENIGG